MYVDDHVDFLEEYKRKKLSQLRDVQQATNWPNFNQNPHIVGKVRTRGINNGNEVYQGPYGDFYYHSRVSGLAIYLKKTTPVDFL